MAPLSDGLLKTDLSSSIGRHLLDNAGLELLCILEGEVLSCDDAYLTGWTFDLLPTYSQAGGAVEYGTSGASGTACSMVADFLVPIFLSNDIFLFVLISALLFELCDCMPILDEIVSVSWDVGWTKLQERSEDISSMRRGKDNGFGTVGSWDPDVWHWIIVAER
jgi:hypothetical protein